MVSGSLVIIAFAVQLAGAGVLALPRPGGIGTGRIYAGAALFFAGCAALFALAVAERNFLLAGAECAALAVLVLLLRRESEQRNGPGPRMERGRTGSKPAKRGIARDSEQKH